MGLRRENIPMNRVDSITYYSPALNNICGPSPRIGSLDKLLGVTIMSDYWVRITIDDRPLPDDWREFLTQLAGPYGKAILKAYRVKYKLEKVEGENVEQDRTVLQTVGEST
jgi:hypothetical protein